MRLEPPSDGPPTILACHPLLMLCPSTSQNGDVAPDTCKRAVVAVVPSTLTVGAARAATPLPLRVPAAGKRAPPGRSGSAAPPAAESSTTLSRLSPVAPPAAVSTTCVPAL